VVGDLIVCNIRGWNGVLLDGFAVLWAADPFCPGGNAEIVVIFYCWLIVLVYCGELCSGECW
jgi:hypothetical protein